MFASLVSKTRSPRAGVGFPSVIFVGAGVSFPFFPKNVLTHLARQIGKNIHLFQRKIRLHGYERGDWVVT